MTRKVITVRKEHQGMRIDQTISATLATISIRGAKNLVDQGSVYLNGTRVRIAGWKVSTGDRIEFTYDDTPKSNSPKLQALVADQILYRTDDLVVINKPANLPAQATHDKSVPHVIPCLARLLASMSEAKYDLNLVHRLDKDTTGCLLIALSTAAMTFLTDQFRTRKVTKVYHAICFGQMQTQLSESARLTPIDEAKGRVQAVVQGGKGARTDFKPLEYFPELGVTLVECRPYTGRSHQIRVHLEKNNFPLVGDKVYGQQIQRVLPDKFTKLVSHHLLHAVSLTFVPAASQPPVTVTAPYPRAMQDFLKAARGGKNIVKYSY